CLLLVLFWLLQRHGSSPQVSVKAGDSVSIPCLYHPKYTSHVKYLCQGYSFISCSCAVKTNQQSSGRFLISDDREKKVFTVTIKDVREGDTDFWCIVEINRGRDVGTYFQVSVTRVVGTGAAEEIYRCRCR
uniref:Immunoglobulin domain-containing protein n=1 Tax=Takifugu rubripes TaxID=31033 RepID=A0A674NTG3_TAKRU